MTKYVSLCSILILWLAFSAQSQSASHTTLTIEKIMQDPEKWIGTLPGDIAWSENSKSIYFTWNPKHDTLSSLHSYSLANEKTIQVPLPEKQRMSTAEGEYNPERTAKVFVRNGNLYFLDLNKGTERQLTNWIGRVSQPRFSGDRKSVSFVFNQNLYLINLETGLLKQLSNFVSGEKPKDKKNSEQAEFLEKQQLEMFGVLKNRDEIRKAREKLARAEKVEQLEPVYIGSGRLRSVSLSPSGRFVIYSVFEPAVGEKETEILNFVSFSGYAEIEKNRSKVGSPQGTLKMAILNLETQKSYPVNCDSLPGLLDIPAFRSDYPKSKTEKPSPRKINLLGPVWNPENDLAVIVARSHDSKDRWILCLNPENGQPTVLDRQHDDAWIGGPGIENYHFSTGKTGWMPDGKSVWFQSEKSGYSHLYSANVSSGEQKQLTRGTFEIYDPFISRDGKSFYFAANKQHPGVRHFYRMSVSGGEMEQITSMEGNNEVQLSPDEKFLAIRFSSGNQPWELFLQENKPGSKARQITHSLTNEFAAYPWRIPEYVNFRAEDGQIVYARLYRPEKQSEKGPAVIFVHGAGYLQNAHKWWSQYFREYMFHNFLVDKGYTVLDIDYRGSSGYGRDWRTGIYRHMGGKDLSDHVDGAKYLIDNCAVSPEKIGIYGGSYGGFITLMGMFKHPEVFKAGAALRSVTDWAHYNHGYTANILNTPAEDSLAYVRSSPIYFALGLKGALLMCHGMIDDNVQFQDIVRLTQRLIELRKENWELAVYPVERHAFTEASSWTDEYRRIFKLFETNLK